VAKDYCAALGKPGNDATYTLAMAEAAAAVAKQPSSSCTSSVGNGNCTGVTTCGSSASGQDVYYVDLASDGGPCFVWAFKTTKASGSTTPSGHLNINPTTCTCPASSDPTWD
jgi:hypothetical protein